MSPSTLTPSSDFGIRGHEGSAYKVNAVCAHPACAKASQEAHHCWARSYLRGQPYEWVQLPDGTIIGNRIGFCVAHHAMLTGEIGGYRARLVWQAGVVFWANRITTTETLPRDGVTIMRDDRNPDIIWYIVGPLTSQPPAMKFGVADMEEPRVEAHGHMQDDERLVCPTCGHSKIDPDAPRPKLPRRKTKEWTINVPDDSEIGADVLDEWVDDLAIAIGAGEWTSRVKRYHVLAVVLGWAIMNRSQLVADMAEAAERRLRVS